MMILTVCQECKLSETEVLRSLAEMQCVSLVDITRPGGVVPIEVALSHRAAREFENRGIEHLEDLTRYSYDWEERENGAMPI